MAIPKKFILGRRAVRHDQMAGVLKPADNKDTKAYQQNLETVKRACGKNLPVIEIDNIPLVGFRIVGSTKYHRESLFTIEHPLGFTFDINTENMMDLIRNNDIVDVEFRNPLFFSDKMKLINADSDLYSNMIKKEENDKLQRKLQSEIKPNTYYKDMKLKRYFHYIGRFHVYSPSGSMWNSNLPEKSSLFHVYYDISNAQYRITSTLRINMEICTRKVTKTPLIEGTLEENIAAFNDAIFNKKVKSYDRTPMLASSRPIKRDIHFVNIISDGAIREPVQGDVVKINDKKILVTYVRWVYAGSTWNRQKCELEVRGHIINSDNKLSTTESVESVRTAVGNLQTYIWEYSSKPI